MPFFRIEYDFPPLRAISMCGCEADNEVDAKAAFFREMDSGHRIRKVEEVPKKFFDNFSRDGNIVGSTRTSR